jgi:hypothetical protein
MRARLQMFEVTFLAAMVMIGALTGLIVGLAVR